MIKLVGVAVVYLSVVGYIIGMMFRPNPRCPNCLNPEKGCTCGD